MHGIARHSMHTHGAKHMKYWYRLDAMLPKDVIFRMPLRAGMNSKAAYAALRLHVEAARPYNTCNLCVGILSILKQDFLCKHNQSLTVRPVHAGLHGRPAQQIPRCLWALPSLSQSTSSSTNARSALLRETPAAAHTSGGPCLSPSLASSWHLW